MKGMIKIASRINESRWNEWLGKGGKVFVIWEYIVDEKWDGIE